jgi:chemotaxis protein MotA
MGVLDMLGRAGFSLIDPDALVIVLGCTFLAALLGCGLANLRCAILITGRLLHRPVQERANRAALARILCAIGRKGPLAAEVKLPPDPSLAAVVAAYLRLGEAGALGTAGEVADKEARAERAAAVACWLNAAELAPVSGLAGTLYSIARLAPDTTPGLDPGITAAIATAVVSSLYGLALAHLVCFPIAGAIERRGAADDAIRSRLIAWFAMQLSQTRHAVGSGQQVACTQEAA